MHSDRFLSPGVSRSAASQSFMIESPTPPAVPPAELESVLLTHPDVADVAVIGIQSEKEATELPRAYVVHARPEELKNEAQKTAFSQNVRSWMQGKVANYKFLRGGAFFLAWFWDQCWRQFI